MDPVGSRIRGENRTFVAAGAPIVITDNLVTAWGVTNGATGVVEGVLFAEGHYPGVDFPDVLMVRPARE